MNFRLSPGQAPDAPDGRQLLTDTGPLADPVILDRTYEDNETRPLVLDLDRVAVVPPQRHRMEPWEYDRVLYKRRNEVERLFRRLKGFRRIFARFDKLDVVFVFFLHLALIVGMSNSVNTL